VVIAIVNHGGTILGCIKRSDSTKFLARKWPLLGENVEMGEDDEEALILGAMGETWFEVKIGKYLGLCSILFGKRTNFYECFVLSDEIKVRSDLEDARRIKIIDVLEVLKEMESLWSKEV